MSLFTGQEYQSASILLDGARNYLFVLCIYVTGCHATKCYCICHRKTDNSRYGKLLSQFGSISFDIFTPCIMLSALLSCLSFPSQLCCCRTAWQVHLLTVFIQPVLQYCWLGVLRPDTLPVVNILSGVRERLLTSLACDLARVLWPSLSLYIIFHRGRAVLFVAFLWVACKASREQFYNNSFWTIHNCIFKIQEHNSLITGSM